MVESRFGMADPFVYTGIGRNNLVESRFGMVDPYTIDWELLKISCRDRVFTSALRFCGNKYSTTGLCDKRYCPRASYQYATVQEEDGNCFLYTKTENRAAFSTIKWQKLELSKNRKEAYQQIDEQLSGWPAHAIKKCRQRFLKITQYLTQMSESESQGQEKQHGEKQEKESAELDSTSIKREFLKRYRRIKYDRICNIPPPSTVLDVPEEEDDIIDASRIVEMKRPPTPPNLPERWKRLPKTDDIEDLAPGDYRVLIY